MCRVCGGEGENCNTVEGVLDDKVRLKTLFLRLLNMVITSSCIFLGAIDGIQRPFADPTRRHQHSYYGDKSIQQLFSPEV